MQINDVPAILHRIEMRLAELNMPKQEFYEKSGISSGSFSQWNTGTHSPSLKKLKKAADVLKVRVEYLLYGETEKAPGQEAEGMSIGDAERPYVDMNTARIWSRHPVAILAAQYGVPTATLQQIIGCDFNVAGNIALGLAAPTDEQLRRVAAAFCVPYGDLTRGWIPLSANRDLSFDNIPRSSDRSPSPEGQ